MPTRSGHVMVRMYRRIALVLRPPIV